MILIDANIFMYAAGKPSHQRAPCQRFLSRAVDRARAARACTDAEVLQEILHRYRAIGAPDLGFEIFDAVVNLGIPVMDVTEADVRAARVLLGELAELSTRDAIHVGVMKSHGITRILSYDRGFDRAPGLQRMEP